MLWFLLWVGVTFFGLLLQPSPNGHGTHQQLGLAPCPSVLFTERPCPGCGLTTSISAVIHGRIGDAFRAHPFGPVVYVALTLSAWACLYGYVRGWRFDTSSRSLNWAIGLFLAAFLAYGAARFATARVHWAPEPMLWRR